MSGLYRSNLELCSLVVAASLLVACATPAPTVLSTTTLPSPVPSARPTDKAAARAGGFAFSPIILLPPTPMPPTPAPTLAYTPPGPGVADILARRPAPGESVELDAYFSGAGVPEGGCVIVTPDLEHVCCPGRICTGVWTVLLTDRPYQVVLGIGRGVTVNTLPEDAPWLIAATEEGTKPGVYAPAQLPFYARLRGHLDNTTFAHCNHADRIFVVESVVKVYQKERPPSLDYRSGLPEDYTDWPRYHDATWGYSIPYPPNWQVERTDATTVAIRAPAWPQYPLQVRVHDGEIRLYDPDALKGLTWLQQAQGMGVYQHGGYGGSGLPGYVVDLKYGPDERIRSFILSGSGHIYELTMRYPLGFDYSQALVNHLGAIVAGFRLDMPPTPTVTPTRFPLGEGPFLSRDEIIAIARERYGDIEILDARLVAEKEARYTDVRTCYIFPDHPEGVWLLVVRGELEGATRTVRFFLNGKTGEQSCGEEIVWQATPTP